MSYNEDSNQRFFKWGKIGSDSASSVAHVSLDSHLARLFDLTLFFFPTAIKSFTTGKSSEMVQLFGSNTEAEKSILEENKRDCDFFTYFKYDESNKLGSVSSYVALSSHYVTTSHVCFLWIRDVPPSSFLVNASQWMSVLTTRTSLRWVPSICRNTAW